MEVEETSAKFQLVSDQAEGCGGSALEDASVLFFAVRGGEEGVAGRGVGLDRGPGAVEAGAGAFEASEEGLLLLDGLAGEEGSEGLFFGGHGASRASR